MKLFGKFSNNHKPSVPSALTAITRTETFEGFSIPGIIHNMQYHYTNLQVYSDGLISCWEMVDLSMFKDKLDQKWVVPSIPDGEAISIFNLGHWIIEDGQWHHNAKTFYNYVYSLVTLLNPKLENPHNYHGSSTKLMGKVNVGKHSPFNSSPYYLEDQASAFPKKNNGESFHFFFRNDDEKTYLADLSLYKNGRIEITNLPTKKIFDFADLNDLSIKGLLTTEPPPGERITILNLGSFKIQSGNAVKMDYKLNELSDKLNELNGGESAIDKCRRIFELYMQNPTMKLKDELKDAYEAVPENRRIFVGNMDTKDYGVRLVIYGDIVKKEWEERYGYDYPHEDMPKPVDE